MYETLGLAKDATPEEIKKAYRKVGNTVGKKSLNNSLRNLD